MLLKNGGAHASRYRPSVRVDLVLLLVQEGALYVLLEQRLGPPFRGYQVLPGCSLRQAESPDQAANRVLRRSIRPEAGQVHQLHTYGEPSRDPRGHVLSIAYLGLAETGSMEPLAPNYQLGRLQLGTAGKSAEHTLEVSSSDGSRMHIGFDHRQIIEHGLNELQARIFRSPLGYSMLRPEFTLRELRHLHETVLNEHLNKDNFRRKIIATGMLEETGRRQTHVGYRPAKLYRAAH